MLGALLGERGVPVPRGVCSLVIGERMTNKRICSGSGGTMKLENDGGSDVLEGAKRKRL